VIRIFKYPAPIGDSLVLEMPRRAKVLTVQLQHGLPQIWALVEDDGSAVPRAFRWFGTGHTVERTAGSYVGTVQLEGGALVFHLFEMAAA
jgi:hypothetical protein